MAAMGGSGSADAAASSGSARRRRQQRQRQLSRHVTWLSGLLQCKSHHTGGGGGGSGQCPGCCALSKRISSLEAALERHAVPRQEGERASGIEAPEATPSGLAAPTAEVPPGELPRDLHEQGDGERTQDIDPGELSKSKPHEEAHKFIIEEVCEPTSERASDIEASEATPSGLAVTTAEVSPGELSGICTSMAMASTPTTSILACSPRQSHMGKRTRSPTKSASPPATSWHPLSRVTLASSRRHRAGQSPRPRM